ncbi:MAG: tetratricopeptide repeat protein, partial [Saprospiraceae bacterium]
MRPNPIFFLLLAWLSFLPGAFAGKYFDFSPAVHDAYRQATSLRLGESQAALELLKTSEPDNLMVEYVANYVDFLTVFVHGNKAEYNRRSRNMEPRLDKISRGDQHSPYVLYTQAQVRLQWALLRLRFSEYLAGASDIKQAYALLEENQRRFPDFMAT